MKLAFAKPKTKATELAPPRPAGTVLRARRSPKLIIIGLLCACLGALGMAWAWTNAQDAKTVVLSVKDIYRGQQISAADLQTGTVGLGAGVSVIPAEKAGELIGQFARYDLPAGSIVAADAIGQLELPGGAVQLGLQLAPGRLPNQELPPASKILLVEVADANGKISDQPAVIPAETVGQVQTAPDGQHKLVDIRLDAGHGALVARLAAANQLVVVRQGGA